MQILLGIQHHGIKKVFYFFVLINLIFISPFVLADGMHSEEKGKTQDSQSQNTSAGSHALSEDKLLDYQYCGQDSDCMKIINGCCQCLQGDKYVSIAKNRYEAFQKNFQCENVLCPKEEENMGCNDGVISCVNHRCSYFILPS